MARISETINETEELYVDASDSTLSLTRVEKLAGGADPTYVDAVKTLQISQEGISVIGNDETGAEFQNDLLLFGDYGEPLPEFVPITLGSKMIEYNSETGTYETPKAIESPDGRIVLSGLIKVNTAVASSIVSGDVLVTLPEGYRPEKQTIHLVASASGVARVDAKADGNIVFTSFGSVTSITQYISLDGISFIPEKGDLNAL